jgi:hypothetical protein
MKRVRQVGSGPEAVLAFQKTTRGNAMRGETLLGILGLPAHLPLINTHETLRVELSPPNKIQQ